MEFAQCSPPKIVGEATDARPKSGNSPDSLNGRQCRNHQSFPWGKVLLVAWSRCHSTGSVPKALREREADSLPYSGWGLLVGTIQRTAFCIGDIATPHQSACGRQLPPGGSRGVVAARFTIQRTRLIIQPGPGICSLPYSGGEFWMAPFNRARQNVIVSTAGTNRAG